MDIEARRRALVWQRRRRLAARWAAALAVGVSALFVWQGQGAAPKAPGSEVPASPQSSSAGPRDSQVDWLATLAELDRCRSQVISARAVEQLGDCDALASAQLSQDQQALAAMTARGLQVDGIPLELVSASEVSHRWSGSREFVVLRVVDRLRGQSIVEAGKERSTEPTPERTWLVTLARQRDKWLLYETRDYEQSR